MRLLSPRNFVATLTPTQLKSITWQSQCKHSTFGFIQPIVTTTIVSELKCTAPYVSWISIKFTWRVNGRRYCSTVVIIWVEYWKSLLDNCWQKIPEDTAMVWDTLLIKCYNIGQTSFKKCELWVKISFSLEDKNDRRAVHLSKLPPPYSMLPWRLDDYLTFSSATEQHWRGGGGLSCSLMNVAVKFVGPHKVSKQFCPRF